MKTVFTKELNRLNILFNLGLIFNILGLIFFNQNTSHLSSLVSAFHLQKVSPASQTKLDLICSRSVSVPQRLRVMGSLFIIMFVFIITAVLVKVPLEPLPFFSITMVKIIIINSFGAVLQGSLFGMAGLLPASYTTPIMSGQGLAGTFAAASMICAIASGSELEDAAFGYFIVACVVIFLSILSYVLLPKLVKSNRNMKLSAIFFISLFQSRL
uniref:Solute carrier family 29 member 1b n=1 Tax=Xiphophorus couchianus TaxID=32473 RepID=A0A3B5LUS6_9TELE